MIGPTLPNELAISPTSIPAGPPSPVPRGEPRAGGTRRLIYEGVLATNVLEVFSEATMFGKNVARALTTNPSNRLAHKVTIGYRAYTSEEFTLPPSGPLAWVWTAQEWAYTFDGKKIPGAILFANLALPNSWEGVTLSREWRHTITIPFEHEGGEGPLPGTGLGMAGQLWIVAEWEPAPGDAEIPDDELQRLFGACRLDVGASVAAFSELG